MSEWPHAPGWGFLPRGWKGREGQEVKKMTEKTTRRIPLVRTRGKGLPALWEQGGGYRNTGFATIVAGREGERLRPFYVRGRGHLANGEHALLPVKPGYVVVEADHHREDFRIQVWEVLAIDGDEATLGLVAEFDEGEWDHPLPQKYLAAVEAAKEKATCYHCRAPHFVAPE